MIEKLKNKKYLGILVGVVAVLFIAIIIGVINGVNKNGGGNGEKHLEGIFPNGEELAEFSMGTYYKDKQTKYCNIKLPGNYYGWAMYLTKDGANENFEMATSNFLSESINSGISKQEEAIQQFYYSNSQLVEEGQEKTEIYATIFKAEQITYEGMKSQISGATDIKEIGKLAFYNKGDKKYTDIDVTMYYKLDDEITLEISYKGPLAEEIGVDKIAKKLYDLIEVIK